jgi:hypothetical protein
VADLTRVEIHHLALLGAKARLEELRREQAAILKAFPGLVTGRNAHQIAVAAPQVKRRRKAMSAAARKEVSARMKKYWAARRKESPAKTAK